MVDLNPKLLWSFCTTNIEAYLQFCEVLSMMALYVRVQLQTVLFTTMSCHPKLGKNSVKTIDESRVGRSCADTVVGGVRRWGRRPCAGTWTRIVP